MTQLIIRLFIKNADNTSNPAVRAKYGIVGSVVGIVCNLLLAALKFVLGTVSNSISVTADAVNNLSDTASSAVTLIGFRLSSKPADREHPFGHGRLEYVCGLVIAFFILIVGFEILKGSFSRIFSDEHVLYNPIVVVGLIISILVKFWMTGFNRTIGKKISSAAMHAVAADSISDAMSTGVTLLAVIAANFTALPVDGYVGIIVSAFVIYSGVNIIRDTLSPLLGRAPDADIVRKIRDTVLGHDKILGIHDLIVHEYGPGRIFASLHAEVSSKEDIMESHSIIDHIESDISERLGIEILIHMDPLEVECSETCRIRDEVSLAVKALDESFDMHDFRIVPNGEHKNLIFDVAIPIDYPAPDSVVSDMINTSVSALDMSYIVKATIDRVI